MKFPEASADGAVGRHAELCGTYHAAMNFEVRAVPEGFTRRTSSGETVDPATGEPLGGGALSEDRQ